MEDIESLITNNEQRANAIAKLLQLIEMDTEIIQQYRLYGTTDLHVQQYIELRNQNIERLSKLMQTSKLNIHLSFDEAAYSLSGDRFIN